MRRTCSFSFCSWSLWTTWWPCFRWALFLSVYDRYWVARCGRCSGLGHKTSRCQRSPVYCHCTGPHLNGACLRSSPTKFDNFSCSGRPHDYSSFSPNCRFSLLFQFLTVLALLLLLTLPLIFLLTDFQLLLFLPTSSPHSNWLFSLNDRTIYKSPPFSNSSLLTLGFINIQSCRNKCRFLSNIFFLHRISILCIAET